MHMFLKTFCLCSLLAVSISAEEQEIAASLPSNRIVARQDLKGILLIPSRNDLLEKGEGIEGFGVYQMDIPGGSLALNEALADQFIGKVINQEMLRDLKQEVVLYYRDQGFPLVAVEIPEQNISKGVVQLVVTESVLGKVIIRGNRHFSTNSLKSCIRAHAGDKIHSATLLEDIAWINRNSFRHADLLFAPGEKEGTTDVEVIIKDRLPLQVYAGVDNTGITSTGHLRWFTGLRWGNVFGLGHTFNYQFTTASEYRKFWAHSFMYNAPLSWRHVLLVYGGFSQIHPDIKDFRSHGHNTQVSVRYQMPIPPTYNRFIQEPSIGYDFKNLNSNLFYSQPNAFTPVVSHQVNIMQFYAGYSLGKKWDKNTLSFRVEGFWSPGAMTIHQSNEDFSSLHPGAKNHYFYSRLSFSDTWTLPMNFALSGQFRGQISTQNLVPSEQFGLGGYETVRGYQEREWNYDDAICLNLECYMPAFSLTGKLARDQAKFLLFFDYGTGRNVHVESGPPQWQHLMSVGPGFRYQFSRYLSARVDWGIRLDETTFNGYGSRVHFGLMGSY